MQIISLFYFRHWLIYYEYETTGSYEVGYKEFRLPNQKQTVIGVFYPCFYDKELDKREIKVKWLRDGWMGLKGYCMAWTFGKQNTKFEEIMHSDLLVYDMNVHFKAQYHDDFVKGYKKMVPIVFSPGIMGMRTLSSNICRNLASHGCIVYAIEHTDGTACYYNNPSSDEMPHNFIVTYKQEFGISEEEEHRVNEMKLRISEIKELITYVKSKCEYINISQLGICGFSFGAMTALEANYQINEIKYSISLDPYFRPRWKEILGDSNLFSTTKPYLILNSEIWHDTSCFTTDFPSWKTVCEFHKNNLNYGKAIRFNVKLKNSDHMIFTDLPMIYPLYFKADGLIPKDCNIEQKTSEVNKVIIAYLNKVGILQELNHHKIEKFEFLEYH